MNRTGIIQILTRTDSLAAEIENFVPSNPSAGSFRADLAGLLLVNACATYETCVKEVMYAYASRHSPQFKGYTERRYQKINSKIDISDLHSCAKNFDPDINVEFKKRLKHYQDLFLIKSNVDIKARYTQILEWRHSVAHTGARVTTVEEVLKHHRASKRILFAFCEAFSKY